jgi:hypothetical protein
VKDLLAHGHQVLNLGRTVLRDSPALNEWAAVAGQLVAEIEAINRDPSRKLDKAALGAVKSDREFQDPYRAFVHRARAPFAPASQPTRLDQLTLVLLCTAAGAGQELSPVVGHGLRQCYQALLADKASPWGELAQNMPHSVGEIDEALLRHSPAVIREFLAECCLYLSTEIGEPNHEIAAKDATGSTAATADDGGATTQKRGRPRVKNGNLRGDPEQDKQATKPQEVCAPSVTAMVRSSQLVPLGAKAGVHYQWNSLIPEDLARLTRRLCEVLDEPGAKRVAMAALSLTALLLRTNPKAARLTPTQPGSSPGSVEIWVDIDRGWIWWLHDAYTDTARPPDATGSNQKSTRVNVIAMPRRLAQVWRLFRGMAEEARTLDEIIVAALGTSNFSMYELNALLKELGDDAHLAEPTRVANAMGLAILAVTRSDMAAALIGFHFEISASSSLFYFSPSREWVEQRLTDLYDFLGLGKAESLDGAPPHMGAGKHHDENTLRAGWSRLVAEIIRLSETVQRWPTDADGIAALNGLAPLCCSAFVISVGGRGTEPGRITVASVLASAEYFALLDKLTDGDKSARVLPHTAISTACVCIFMAARAKATTHLRLSIQKTTACNESVFATIQVTRDIEARCNTHGWIPGAANQLTDIARQYFDAELNFQRGLWVTELGEACVNRWLIRALTGHGSFLTQAFAPGMNVAPAEALSTLYLELDTRALRLFGDTGPLTRHADDLPTPKIPSLPIGPARTASPLSGIGPVSSDPLPPLDTQCLIDRSLVIEVRQRLAAGDAYLSVDGQLVASMLTVSGVTTLEAAINAATESTPLTHVASTVGASWGRRHYVHPIWLPLQRPTLALFILRGTRKPATREQLIGDTARWLRSLPGYHGWPMEDYQVLVRFEQACRAWRRVELRPSTCAMASTAVETACLSALSLHRLSTGGKAELGDIGQLARRFARVNRPKDRVHDLGRIVRVLNDIGTHDEAKGATIARGQALKAALEDLGPYGSPVFQFARRYCACEGEEMSKNLPVSDLERRRHD